MATDEQIKANQENSQLSTGPSESGKQRSKLNSTKHGFTGQTVVLTESEKEPYRLFTEKHLKQLKPVGVDEEHFAHSVIDCRWRIHQISATEAATFALGIREHASKFENETPAMAEAMARALTLSEKQKELGLLNRYQTRLTKQAALDLEELRTLQKLRKEEEVKQFHHAMSLAILSAKEKKPFNPQEFGFVWTEEQIVGAIIAKNTLRHALRSNLLKDYTHQDLPKMAS
jgi:hypothetical protein